MENIDVSAPLASLQWVDRNTIHANDYNPNKVSEENLKLLVQSILTNGWTLPIVVRPDGTIIDGFHRWTVSGREPLLSLLGGKVPVVVVDHHGDESADVYGTITHNRARGTHDVDLMSNIIRELHDLGRSDVWICKHLGMDKDDLLRLKQISGLTELFRDSSFGRAWKPLDQADTAAAIFADEENLGELNEEEYPKRSRGRPAGSKQPTSRKNQKFELTDE